MQDEKLVVERKLVLCILQVLLEQLFSKPLGVVDEMQRREVQGVWRMLLLVVSVVVSVRVYFIGKKMAYLLIFSTARS